MKNLDRMDQVGVFYYLSMLTMMNLSIIRSDVTKGDTA